ncbi:MAG: hypothetical protein ACI9GW_003556 [Halieaceae bacterium]|jgi:hypothetical protein
MSEDECRVADWVAVGYEDGTRGVAADHMSEHRSACADYGIAPDMEAWLQGRERGLTEYCRPGKGFEQGRVNGEYRGVCRGAAEVAFLAGYADGQVIGDFERAISTRQSELYRAESDLEDLDKWYRRAGDVESTLVDSSVSEEERRELLRDIRAYERDRADLVSDIRELELQVVALQTELRILRDSLRY